MTDLRPIPRSFRDVSHDAGREAIPSLGLAEVFFWLNLLAAAGFLALAVATRRWVWTAVPVGQLFFGFFLAKGDLCGASAFSEVLLMRDGRKAFGIWTAIVTAMLLFAVMQAAGLVTLAPKPLLWANAVVGGLDLRRRDGAGRGVHQRMPLQGGRRQSELDRRPSHHPRGDRLCRARPAFEDQRIS